MKEAILLNEVRKSTSEYGGRVSSPIGTPVKRIRRLIAIEGMSEAYAAKAPPGTVSVIETEQGRLFNVSEIVETILEKMR